MRGGNYSLTNRGPTTTGTDTIDTVPQTAGLPKDLTRDHALLLEAVRAAGQTALDYFGRSPRKQTKPDGTEVSEADLAVDAALKRQLTDARPDYGWLSEESDDDLARLHRASVWVVDPIDGTRAFLKEKPEWTVAAALVSSGRPVIAAVYNPATEELFDAVTGGGTRLNGESVRVREPVALEDARLIASKGLFRHNIWDEPWPSVETRWVNSVAYRLALVAAGKSDGTLSLSKKHDWDLAAAELLVQEAGGIVTSHLGDALHYNQRSALQQSLVAAGPSLHADLLARTRTAKI